MALSNAERQRRYRARRGKAVDTAAALEAANADLRGQVETLMAEVDRLRSAGPGAGVDLGALWRVTLASCGDDPDIGNPVDVARRDLGEAVRAMLHAQALPCTLWDVLGGWVEERAPGARRKSEVWRWHDAPKLDDGLSADEVAAVWLIWGMLHSGERAAAESGTTCSTLPAPHGPDIAVLQAEVDRLREQVAALKSGGVPVGRYVGPLDPHPVPLDTLTNDELVEVTRQRSPIVQPALDWLDEPGKELESRARQAAREHDAALKARGVEVAAKVRKATGSKHAGVKAVAKRAGVEVRWIMHLIEHDAAPAMAHGNDWIASRRWKFLEAVERAASAA